MSGHGWRPWQLWAWAAVIALLMAATWWRWAALGIIPFIALLIAKPG